MELIKTGVIDDHTVVLNGLQAMFENHDRIRLSFSTTSPEALLDYLASNTLDVLLLDIQLPGTSGIDICKQVLKLQPAVRVLAFTSSDDTRHIKQIMRMGAAGYALKNTDQETLAQAILTIHEGGEFLDESIKKSLLSESLSGQRRSMFEIPLTKRELEILKLIGEENSNQQISEKLFISLRTVETHRLNLSQKLGAKNTVSLVREALRRGLIE
ncbi:response regulator transcription factor [Paraflavitalea sp. CAU 1676]|uniref:response regulator n=1 Tax=Paraflavitalea sp. CAU 1676 TaxID=3032598 RepID=UPI0023DA2F02|nr:response regulator transcription factor [Paraflavitalea sp. CAU 1676]MDF2193289.1 response regulator transcription factor [Paraflavitalea sp. CAU 1676]